MHTHFQYAVKLNIDSIFISFAASFFPLHFLNAIVWFILFEMSCCTHKNWNNRIANTKRLPNREWRKNVVCVHWDSFRVKNLLSFNMLINFFSLFSNRFRIMNDCCMYVIIFFPMRKHTHSIDPFVRASLIVHQNGYWCIQLNQCLVNKT